MGATRADLLTAAQRSLAAAGAHDRAGWIGLFTDDARVEDPVGSQPHCGKGAIGRFYDTFIAPRSVTFRPHVDIVVGSTVLRDLDLEIEMASNLTMQVPAYIRYDLRADPEDLRIAQLSAYWELPAMIGQFVRGGIGAVPAGITLGKTMFANQGLSGSLGFISAFRGLGAAPRTLFARFLDEVCDGDEVGVRRLAADIPITVGDTEPLTTSELVKYLGGGKWYKLIRSGRAVAARVERAAGGHRGRGRQGGQGGQVGHSRHCVIIGDFAPDRAAISRIRLFGETRRSQRVDRRRAATDSATLPPTKPSS